MGVMDGRRCGKSTTIAEKDRPWEALRRRTSRKMHEIDGYERLGGADSYLDSGLRRQPQPPPAVVYRIVDGPAALPEGL